MPLCGPQWHERTRVRRAQVILSVTVFAVEALSPVHVSDPSGHACLWVSVV